VARGFPDYFFFLLPMGVNDGGTGATSFTANGVLLGNGANIIQATGAGSADQVLRVPAAGGAPAFGAVDLSKAAAVTGILPVAQGGSGSAAPSLVAGTGITITGTWPANTITLTTPVAIANGGTGTATPSLLGGTNIGISGTWPNQQVAFSGILAVGSGGSGTATPALVQGAGMTITGTWPGHTIALTTPVAVALGGTGTATGSITGTGGLTFAAGGSNQGIALRVAGFAYISLGDPAGYGLVTIQGAAGTGRYLQFWSGNSPRWTFFADTIAESGANAGSNLAIHRYDDGGTWLGYGLFIRRSDGQVGIGTESPGKALDVVGDVRASLQLISTVAIGTAPLAVTSTTMVTNLNAERVAGTQVTNAATLGLLLIGSGAGTAAWSTPDGARVYHSVNQNSTSGANLTLAFDSERYDNGGLHDTVTNNSRLTAVKAGKYLITGHVEVAPNATGYRRLRIDLNATASIAQQLQKPDGTAYDLLSLATVYHLAANDYVQLVFLQNSTATLAISAVSPYTPEFAMQWLGP
jgi:hypothetical protein